MNASDDFGDESLGEGRGRAFRNRHFEFPSESPSDFVDCAVWAALKS